MVKETGPRGPPVAGHVLCQFVVALEASSPPTDEPAHLIGSVTFVPVLTGRHSSNVGVPARHRNTALDTARSKYQVSKPAQLWD